MSEKASRTFAIPGLPNLANPESGFASGGQPGPVQLESAAKAGIRHVINLRAPSEDPGFDERAKVAELGLGYDVLPIAGSADLTRTNVERFDTLLAAHAGTPMLIHCGSGNRVGALMALRAGWLQGKSKAEALALGRRWGLTQLEAIVDQMLT